MKKTFGVEKINDALNFVTEQLLSLKISQKEADRARLMTEEALTFLIEHGNFETQNFFSLSVKKFFGNVSIFLQVPGEKINFSEEISPSVKFLSEDEPDTIRNILLGSFAENLKYKRTKNFNIIRVSASRSSYEALLKIMGAFFLAIAAGLLMKLFASEEICAFVNEDILIPIRTIFINGMMLCAAPIVFSSILLSVSDFGSVSGIKKIGARLLNDFVFAKILALFVGFSVVYILGTGKGANMILPASEITHEFSFSLKEVFINFIPSNVIKPFIDMNMLQIVVLGIFIGMLAGSTGANTVLNFFREVNAIFIGITEILLRFVLLVVFCSILSQVITTGANSFLSMFGIFFAVIAALFVLCVIYCVVLMLYHLKPSKLFQKSLQMIFTALSTCSSNATLPECMNAAEALGVPQKIYSFGLPIGLILGKAPSVLYHFTLSLSAANMYGIHLSAIQIFSLGLSVIILVISNPAIPSGSFAIVISTLLTQIGCPLEILGIMIGLDAVLDMFLTAANSFNNLFVNFLTARQENLLDVEKYNS